MKGLVTGDDGDMRWHRFCNYLIGAGQLCLWRILYINILNDSCHVMLVLSRNSGRLADSLLCNMFPCPCCCIIEEWHILVTCCQETQESNCSVWGGQILLFNGGFLWKTCLATCSDSVLRLYDHLSFELPRGGYEADRSSGPSWGYWAC